ncbi:MAG: polysaccharide deacetylase family protein [Candidatus Cloacimonadaceae bacterium]|nr:polysaccharide deacetylase family protein [Candidatus Cloacimonadaceae bacterium]MDP3113632.1 polysaccharide deacetylase family protein [Candidatus Cloacimonadaceae bacterium]
MRRSVCKARCALIFSLLLCLAGCRFISEERAKSPIIVFTFDDAHVSIIRHGFPILSEYGFRGTNFVNSGRIGNPNRMTWDDLRTLEHIYGWETGGHTMNHEDLPEISFAEAETTIRDDYRNLVQNELNPRSFALPKGACPQEYYQIILRYYKNIRNSSDFAMQAPVNRLALGYLPFLGEWTAAQIKDRIMRGIANRESIIIIGFHHIETPDAPTYDNCPTSELREIMRFVSERGLRVLPLAEAIEEL